MTAFGNCWITPCPIGACIETDSTRLRWHTIPGESMQAQFRLDESAKHAVRACSCFSSRCTEQMQPNAILSAIMSAMESAIMLGRMDEIIFGHYSTHRSCIRNAPKRAFNCRINNHLWPETAD